ncbi:MAG: integrase core domain-containing protein [Phycisphaerales bacterium]
MRQFNAKVERFFWSLKRRCWVSLVPPKLGAIQQRLDAYAAWHNRFRPHAALGPLTPNEAAAGETVPEAVRFTQRGELAPSITIKRQHVSDDPRLQYSAIKVSSKHRFTA